MKSLTNLVRVETRLLLREPAIIAFALLVPLGLILVFGLGSPPSPGAVGQHDQPTFLPALSLMIAVGMLGFMALPGALGSYREKGILRRLSTTPVHPGKLLAAQLIVQLMTALLAVAVLILAGYFAMDLPLPRNVPGFTLAVVLGLASLFAIGTVIAALSPNARVAGSVGPLLFFPMLFLAGAWLPRDQMPDWLATIGTYSPLGVLIDTVGTAWAGANPDPAQLAVMVALAAVFGFLATRLFRWE